MGWRARQWRRPAKGFESWGLPTWLHCSSSWCPTAGAEARKSGRVTISEHQLQSQLNTAGIARRKNLAERGGADEVVGQAKVRAIERIECLNAELHRGSLSNCGVLDERQIHGGHSRAFHSIAAGVAEGTVGRNCERRCIEPLVGCGIGKPGIPNHVGPVVRAETQAIDRSEEHT